MIDYPLILGLFGTSKEAKTSQSSVFENVIRPMVNASLKAFVYLPKKEANEEYNNSVATLPLEIRENFAPIVPSLDLSSMDILIKDRGKYRIDTTKECIIGYEQLWLANGYMRGSIIIILPHDFNFINLLPYCNTPMELLTPNMGQSPGAVKLCKKARDNGYIAVIFSAAQGLNSMNLYASKKITNTIHIRGKLD